MAHTSSPICHHQRPLTVFASPSRYVQGPGATHELGRELSRLGLQGRVLFVAGGTAQRALAPIWQSALPPEGLEPVVVAFGGECSAAEIERLVGQARTSRAVAVVGAGGARRPTRPGGWPMRSTCRRSSPPPWPAPTPPAAPSR
jgi:hypothetical protein